MITAALSNAVTRSISHTEIVHVEIEDHEAAILSLIETFPDLGIDYSDCCAGTDVWAWDSDTPEGESIWRLMLEDPS